MNNVTRITGLVPAVFSPMHDDGRLNLDQIGPIVDQLVSEKVGGLYVCGSTGEGPSLSGKERQAVATAYIEAAARRIPVIIQVGHNSLAEACTLAEHAQKAGADAISTTPPTYFKPASVDILIKCLAEVAAGAPELPLYYYHIPGTTGVNVDVVALLQQSSQHLPTLAGVKYSTSTIFELQACINLDDGRFNILFGVDEMLLSGLAVGVDGAVGSTYNFAAPLFQRIIEAFAAGDMATARHYQGLAVQMVRVLMQHGGATTFKATMKLVGFDCGAYRLPITTLDKAGVAALKHDLAAIGFFEWARPSN